MFWDEGREPMTSPAPRWAEWDVFQHTLTSCCHIILLLSLQLQLKFLVSSVIPLFLILSVCPVQHVLSTCDERHLLLAVVWWSGWQLASCLFFYLSLPSWTDTCDIDIGRSVRKGRDGWTDVRTVMRVSHQRYISWELLSVTHLDFMDSSSRHIYTVDTHTNEYPPTMFTWGNTSVLNPEMCLSSFYLGVTSSEHRGVSAGQLTLETRAHPQTPIKLC